MTPPDATGASWRGSVLRSLRATARERDAVIRAYADALFPADGPIPISGSEAGAVEFMRNYLERSQPRQRLLVSLLIAASQLGPLLFGARRALFTRLTPAERQVFIAEGYASALYPRRVLVLTMRALLTMAYFAHDAVLAHVGMRHDRDPFGLDARAEPPAPKASEVRVKELVHDEPLSVGHGDDGLDGVA